jgi:hypothetical protein
MENAARKVGERLQDAAYLDVRRTEPTITEDLFLELARQFHLQGIYPPGVKPFSIVTVPTSSKHEAAQGTDWEWSISDGKRFVSCVVQAKRLYKGSLDYDELGYKSKNQSLPQMDVLLNYAKSTGAVPLYAFYNPVFSVPGNLPPFPSLTCGLGSNQISVQPHSWGVSVAHAEAVKSAYGSACDTSFTTHVKRSRPLRCLTCPGYLGRSAISVYDATVFALPLIAHALDRLKEGWDGVSERPDLYGFRGQELLTAKATDMAERAWRAASAAQERREREPSIVPDERFPNCAGVVLISVPNPDDYGESVQRGLR